MGLNPEFAEPVGDHKKRSKPTLYIIEPLKWGKKGKCDIASTSVGEYGVELAYNDCGKDVFKWWHWSLSIGKWSNYCSSIEDGKAQAQEHYEKRLRECLRVYNG